MQRMVNLFRGVWGWLNEPSSGKEFEVAFNKLQEEKRMNGRSVEYQRIWREEVCPAYRKLSEVTPKFLRHPETDHILHDMDKPLGQRRYY